MLKATLNNLISATNELKQLLKEQENEISKIETFYLQVLQQQKFGKMSDKDIKEATLANFCQKCGLELATDEQGFCGVCSGEQNSEVQNNN